MLLNAALAGAEKLINAALVYDPGSRLRLAKLAGQILAIRVSAPALNFYVMPDEDGLCLMANWQGEVDTEISGSLFALLQLATTEPHNLKYSGVSAMGDLQLLAELQQIVKTLDIDWEEILSQFTGDIIGHQTAELIRSKFNFVANRAASVKRLASEFLTEELKTLPSKPELEDFYQQVDDLRLAVDRAEARVKKLLNKKINK